MVKIKNFNIIPQKHEFADFDTKWEESQWHINKTDYEKFIMSIPSKIYKICRDNLKKLPWHDST